MRRPLLFLALVAASAVAHAQELRPELTRLAIVGAKIETAPGVILENGTILINSGVITAVGTGLTIPPGSDVIDGKGLFVYAGFVDCGVSKGLKDIAPLPRQAEAFDPSADFMTSMPLNNVAVAPDLMAIDWYDPDDAAWNGERAAGFTSVWLLPKGGILKGQAAFVNIDGRARRFSAILDRAGLVCGFEGGGNPYPGTALGAFATARQAFMDTEWNRRSVEAYAAGKGPRPAHDPALDALEQYRATALPLVLDANKAWRIDSALNFASEWKRRPIVFGASQGYLATPLPKNTEIIAKLDFGPEPVAGADDPPAKVAERQRLWKLKVKNAQTLLERGGELSFTTTGCRDAAQFFENLRRIVKEGFPRTAALAALTTQPAHMLGLDTKFGTIAVGKTANLTLMTADFLDPNAKLKLLVIDGNKIDPAKQPFRFDNAVPSFRDGGRR